MATMLIDKPHIAIARPPRRTRKPKPAPKLTRVIVGRRVAPEVPAEAADRLSRELVRRVEERQRRKAAGGSFDSPTGTFQAPVRRG
jgi:hypothetical protein